MWVLESWVLFLQNPLIFTNVLFPLPFKPMSNWASTLLTCRSHGVFGALCSFTLFSSSNSGSDWITFPYSQMKTLSHIAANWNRFSDGKWTYQIKRKSTLLNAQINNELNMKLILLNSRIAASIDAFSPLFSWWMLIMFCTQCSCRIVL